MERLIFPNFTYAYDEQGNRLRPLREEQTAMIFTMNIPEEAIEDWKYPVLLGSLPTSCARISAIVRLSMLATPISLPTIPATL